MADAPNFVEQDAPAPPAPTPVAPEAPPDNRPILLKGKDGGIYKLPAENEQKAIAAGYTYLSPQEAHEQTIKGEEEAKGVRGSIQAGERSFGNQAFFGVPETIDQYTNTPQELADQELRDKSHTFARVFGGSLGLAGNIAGSGGALGALGKSVAATAIAPAEVVAKAALGTKLAARAVDLGTQGMALAAPSAAVQAAFGDPKQAAETLTWGAGAGLVLGASGELLGSALRSAGEAAGKLAKGPLPEAAEGATKELPKWERAPEETAAPIEGAPAPEVPTAPKEAYHGVPDETVKWAEGEGILKSGMTAEDMGASVKDANAKFGAGQAEATRNLDSLLEKSPGVGLEKVEKEVSDHALTPMKMFSSLNEGLQDPELMHMALTEKEAQAAKEFVQSAVKLPTVDVDRQNVITFKTAQDFVDKLRDQYAKEPTELNSVFYKLAKNTLEDSANKVAGADPKLLSELQGAKIQAERISVLEKQVAEAAQNAAESKMADIHGAIGGTPPPPIPAPKPGGLLGRLPSSIQGFADKAGKQAFGAAAGVAGHAIAGPFGGYMARKAALGSYDVLKGIAKGWVNSGSGLTVLSSLAKRTAAEGPEVFSATVAAESAKRVAATMTGVGDTIKRMAIQGLSATGASRMDHMKSLLGDTTGLSHEQQYAKLGSRLATLASNPAALAHVTATLSAPYAATAPAVAQAYQEHLTQTVQYLHAALPKPPGPPLPFAPQDWTPTPTETLAFHDKAEIVANPMRAMVHIERGTFSDAHMDALTTVWPQTHARMVQEIMMVHGSNPSLKLGLQERQGLSKFVGAPLDPTELPQNLATLQKSYAQANPGGSPPSDKRPKGKIKERTSQASAFSATMGPASEPA